MRGNTSHKGETDMSTERNTPATDEGELYIRDLASAADEKDDDEEEDGIVTTMMLGEEGDRTGGDKQDDGEEGIVTTMAVGEEGDRTGGR
jgi:hypothetical protein